MKSRTTAILLCFFLGFLGIHRFYMGYTLIGIIQFLTGGGFLIWAIVDFLRLITGSLSPPDSEWVNTETTKTPETADGYDGEYKDGKFDGQGTYIWSDGDMYEGEWKDGKVHGQGTYTYSSGTKYVGEWKDDQRTGQGTMTYYDGAKYEGGWKDGKRHGQGTQYNEEGKIYFEGEFKEDVLWNGKIFDSDTGNIISIKKEGKKEPQPVEEDAVQEQEVENIEVKQEKESYETAESS